MLTPGSYRVFRIHHTQGGPLEQHIGRFLIQDGNFHILEDYDNLMSDIFPETPVDDYHKKGIWNLVNSGYYKVVHEDEANQGLHDDLIEDLDIGSVEPDAEYIYLIPGSEPQRIEMFGENAIIDGMKLSEEELRKLIEKANEGEARLVPV